MSFWGLLVTDISFVFRVGRDPVAAGEEMQIVNYSERKMSKKNPRVGTLRVSTPSAFARDFFSGQKDADLDLDTKDCAIIFFFL